jgi:predicted lipoprotein with Yx(FWY)xxD motif
VQNATLGQIITDGAGRTLYMYARDTTKNTSTCYDDCAKSWPPFVTQGKTDTLEGIQASLMGTTQRKEGTTQVTYNGWPLYYWNADVKAGDTFGQGIGNVWWVIKGNGDTVTSAPPATITINLGAGRDADQSGTARLTARGDKTQVALNIKPGAAGVEQPAHIHEGACPGVGAVKFPLNNLVDGKSTTTVDASLVSLLTGGFSINVHKSASEMGTYVACGGIPQGVLLKLGPGRDADQAGSAVLLAQGNKTEVDVFIKPVPPLLQPAHIHEGACPGVGAVKYPLTNIEFGSSKTVIDAPLADLLKGGYSINAHKSANDMNVYVACGALAAGT